MISFVLFILRLIVSVVVVVDIFKINESHKTASPTFHVTGLSDDEYKTN